jgi:hypothetical protein
LSQLSPKYDAKVQKQQWRSFKFEADKPQIGLGTIFDRAQKLGWYWIDYDSGDWYDLDSDPLPEVDRDAAPRVNPDDLALLGGSTRRSSALRWLTPSDCDSATSRQYRVKGLTADGDLFCLFGDPGAGKSLLAPHIGYAIARGVPVFGRRTRQGPVISVAAEDGHGMQGRVRALRTQHGDAADFHLVQGVSDLASEGSEQLSELLEAVDRIRPALIVIDTVAIAFPGLDENSIEMVRVVTVGRKLAKHGATVMLIHHPAKDKRGTPTPRGHSSLNGALDVSLYLAAKDENGIICGQLLKNRNGSIDGDFAFRIAVETFGLDDDGDPIEAPFASELSQGTAPRRKKLTGAKLAALNSLRRVAKDGAALEAEWKAACVDGRGVSASTEPDSRRRAAERAIKELLQMGEVTFAAGRYFLNDAAGDYASGDAFDDFDAV